jgi:hypothetical protein
LRIEVLALADKGSYASSPLHAGFLLCLLFEPEDIDMFPETSDDIMFQKTDLFVILVFILVHNGSLYFN